MIRKFTYEEYVEKANEQHNGVYEYPWESNEIDNSHLITIVCLNHGDVKMFPLEHLRKGCYKCFYEDHVPSVDKLVQNDVDKIIKYNLNYTLFD